ncbi:sperm surface protein Sp17 isoform X2 [Leucoraja erinacea]|nr:sperm surface protein Sp17 isoform X2 [Leucoraja erinacea]
MDPVDWAAQLEDRFYNNHIFKEQRTIIPENEPKAAPVTIDTAFQDKDKVSDDLAEPLEGLQKICIKKPAHFTSISQDTISMMLQDKVTRARQYREDATTDVKTVPVEEISQELVGSAPEQGVSDTTKLTDEASVVVPIEVTTSPIMAAGPEESSLEVTTSQAAAVAPEGSPGEITETQPITEASVPREIEDTASEFVADASNRGPLEETTPQVIAAPLEGESKEDEPTQMIATTSAQDEKIPSSKEPSADTHLNEDEAAVIIQSAYRGYSTRKTKKETATPPPDEADGDLFTEAYPGTDGIDYSSGEELAFTEEENTNVEEGVEITHEETQSRMGTSSLHSTVKDGTTETNICAAELGSPIGAVNITADADICRSELQSVMKEDNKREPDMATEMAGHDICETELDQKDVFEDTSGSTANVDTEPGFVERKDSSHEDNKSNEIDIKSQDEPTDNTVEEAARQHEVSGVLTDSQDQENVDQKHTEVITEADLEGNDNPSTDESRSAEEGSNIVE